MWAASTKDSVSQWEASVTEVYFWDQAVRGNSSLRAGLMRESRSEVGSALGESHTESLFDVSKFYDSLQPELVADRCLEANFPAGDLCVALMQYSADRLIKADGHTSRAVVSWCSIIA